MILRKFNNKNSTRRMKTPYKRATTKNYLWGGVL
jgi:hypothetical protein